MEPARLVKRKKPKRPRVPPIVKIGGPHKLKTKVLHRDRKYKGNQ